jgi:hypothetical protein
MESRRRRRWKAERRGDGKRVYSKHLSHVHVLGSQKSNTVPCTTVINVKKRPTGQKKHV